MADDARLSIRFHFSRPPEFPPLSAAPSRHSEDYTCTYIQHGEFLDCLPSQVATKKTRKLTLLNKRIKSLKFERLKFSFNIRLVSLLHCRCWRFCIRLQESNFIRLSVPCRRRSFDLNVCSTIHACRLFMQLMFQLNDDFRYHCQ